MLLKRSTLRRFVHNEAIKHIETNGANWCLPSPARSKSASSCRLVGQAPDGRILVVVETLSEPSSVLSEIYLQSISSSTNDETQHSAPIFKVSAAAIVYHCSLSPDSGAFLLVTFVSIASPFTNQPIKRSRRLHDTILISLASQDYRDGGSWPSFVAGCDVESIMRMYGMHRLVSDTPDPIIGYFLSDDQRHNPDTASDAPTPHHSSVLQIDNISITMEKHSLSYFLISYVSGAILDEYTLSFTNCTYHKPTDITLSRTTIEQINIRFNQAFIDQVKSFVIWHEPKHLDTLFSYMREPVAFRQFLPTTGDLVVITRQRIASQMASIGTANLVVSIYKESRKIVGRTSDLSTSQPGSFSAPQIPVSSMQSLRHITSLCVGPFPDYPLIVAEAFSALIPCTIAVSFGSISSALPIIAFEYFISSTIPVNPTTDTVTSMTAMLTLVSPFTEAVYNTSVRIDTNMEGLKMTGRDEDKLEAGIKKYVDTTNFRLFSAAISSHILHGLSPSDLSSSVLLDSLTFKVIVRNSYRHSFFSVCSTQLFFTSNLVIWIVPDPVASVAKTTLVSCNQIGGFATVFMGTDTLLSIDMTTLFNSGVIHRTPTSACTDNDGIDRNITPSHTDQAQSSLFDIICTNSSSRDDPLLIPCSSSDTLIYQPRQVLRHTTECFIPKSIFKAKSKIMSYDNGNVSVEHSTHSFENTHSTNNSDLFSCLTLSQLTNWDTETSEGCTLVGLFSKLTHLIPITAGKVSYITILKELNLHRSGTLLDCSSKRFVQLLTTDQGIYTCNCAPLAFNFCDQEVSVEELWAHGCAEVRKRFQTIYLYDTYLCQLLAIEVNYPAVLSHLISEEQAKYLHNELQKMKLLMPVDPAHEAEHPSARDFNSLSLRTNRLFLHALLSVQIYSFFYFLSTLAFTYSTCFMQSYLLSNVMSDILGSTFFIPTKLCGKEPSCSYTQSQLIEKLIHILGSSKSLLVCNNTTISLESESPIALFSILYLCSVQMFALSDHDWLSKELACSAFASCYYRKLMRKNLLSLRSIRQFYKYAQPVCDLLDIQFSYLQSLAQVDETGIQVSGVVLKNNSHIFNPCALSVGRLDNSACLHPLSKHVAHMSSVYSCLRDYYIYHRSSVRDWPHQIKFLTRHSFQQFTGPIDAYITEVDTAAFTHKVGSYLAKIQGRMYQVTSQAFSAAPKIWIPLLEIYEEFMGSSYSSLKVRYPGIPENLWKCASNYLEDLGSIPYQSAWIREPDATPQYLYPCYRYTSNYLEPVSRRVFGSNPSHSFKKPLSSVLSLVLEHSVLRLAILQEERPTYPTFLRLLSVGNVHSSESHSEPRSRSRSKLSKQQAQHSEDPISDILSACPTRFIEASQKRLSYIEDQFDLPLGDVSAQVFMELLEFEITYGPVVSETFKPSLVASPTFQKIDSFASISSVSSRPSSRAASKTFRRDTQARSSHQSKPITNARSMDQFRYLTSSNHSDSHASIGSPLPTSTETSFTIKQVHECEGLDRSDLANFLKYL
ncbi:Hypothetical protein GLP15_4387 [Giardia lamblia P15]|uniref:Uncharacterized protein n=1 Tax=Giardia intestinalis (strain P15) TaxID=658858 RepID=E1F7M3_GIAIA|nr:Hypothetical protein GLP15_4387 [Giardia lamblia P15]